MKSSRSMLKWIPRIILLYILFLVFFMVGSMFITEDVMPDSSTSEPGLVSTTGGLLIIALAHVSVVTAIILTSRWKGWKLAISLALAYYGVMTFLTQIETWYFLSSITVGPGLLPRLFLMGIPTAFLFIPVAVWILGKGQTREVMDTTLPAPGMTPGQWTWKLVIIVVSYLILYWGAGYFVAWQNPELRSFYGQPGEALPFLKHTANVINEEPGLFPFQAFRALVWTMCALPIIYGSKVSAWWTALMVGLFFSVPQNAGHIIANPLLPVASVRMSHMIETASSTFIFGLVVVWLLHRDHHSPGDLFGGTPTGKVNLELNNK